MPRAASGRALRFVLAKSVADLQASGWDRLAAPLGLPMSRRYLAVLDAHGPANFRQHYALGYRGDEPVCAVAAQAIELPAGGLLALEENGTEPVAKESLRAKWRAALRKAGRARLARMKLRLLLCGDLLSWGVPGVAFAPDLAEDERWAALDEALRRIRKAARLGERAQFTVLKDLAPDDANAKRALKALRYEALATEPDMVLPLGEGWRGYEDYLKSLSARYRKAAKGIARDLEKGGARVELLADVGGEKNRLYALYRQVQDRAATRINLLPPDFLPAMAQAFGADFRCRVVRRSADGELLGFVTTIKDGATAIGYFIGFDYAANVDLPLYFALLHAVVGDAIELGCRRLSLGRTALDPKARLGAGPERLGVWIRHRVKALTPLVPPLLRGLPHGDPPERNPFKE